MYSVSERRSTTRSAFSPSRRAARPTKEGDQMATMTRWDPFQDLRSAQDEMAQMSPMLAHALGLHGQQQGSGRATTTAWAPALDISERKDAYLITVELPGVELDDVQITMEGSLLSIQGERQILVPKVEEATPKRIQVRPGRARIPAASGEDTTPS